MNLSRFARFLQVDSDITQTNEMQAWRERILSGILAGVAVAGGIVFLANLRVAIQSNDWGLVAAYTGFYSWLLVVTIRQRQISYKIRAATVLISLYGVGVISLWTYGPPGSGRLWLIGFIVVSSIILGLNAGLISLALAVGTFLFVGWFVSADQLGLTSIALDEFVSWFTSGSSLLLIGIILVVPLSILLRGLENSLKEAKTLTDELEVHQRVLEERVAERTEALHLAAEVGHNVAQIHNLTEMLKVAVDLICERFNLYYTQVYLADSSGRALILRAGSGDVGDRLVARSHRLPIGTGSINGTAAMKKRAVIVRNTAVSSIHQPNPLLPETRSEMVVPLLAGERLIGVLDIQDNQSGKLTDETLPAFQVLAGQLAIAIENANLFTEVSEARSEVEAQSRHLVNVGWRDFLHTTEKRESIGYDYQNGKIVPLSEPIVTATRDDRLLDTPVLISGEPVGMIRLEMDSDQEWTPDDAMMVAAVSQQVAQRLESMRLLADAERYRIGAEEATRRLTREGWDSYLETADLANTGFLYDQTQVVPFKTGLDGSDETHVGISKSLTVRGETIGYLEAVEVGGPEEDKDELVTAVARQLSEHIENLRLISQTETALKETAEQARRNVLLSQTSEQLNRAETLDEIYKIIAENTAQILPSDRVTLAILNDDKNRFTVKSLAGTEKDIPMGIAQNISGSIVEKAIKAGTVIVTHDSEPNPYMGISSSMVAPLITNAGAIGTLNVGSKSTNVYDAADQGLMLQIASILSSVIENTRLFSQVEARAGELAVINEVAQVASEQLELKQLFAAIHKQIQNAFFTDAFFVALYDSTDELIHFPYMYDDGQLFDEEPIIPAPDIEVAQVIKTGIPILANLSPEERRQAQATNENLTATNKAPSGMIFVPLRAGAQIVGALSVQNYQFHPYNESDLTLLEGIANHVAVAMENVRLFEATQVALADSKQNQREIEQRANELATINTVSKVSSSQLNLAELLDAVGETLRSTFDAVSVYFALFDHQTEMINFPHFYLEEEGQVAVESIPLKGSGSFTSQIIQTCQPLLHNTILEQSTPETILDSGGMVAGNIPTRMTDSFLGVPMILGEEVFGVIGVSTFYERHVYNEDDQRLLVTLASTISVAVQNARQYQLAKRQAAGEALINVISQKIQMATNVQSAIQAAVSELGQALKLKRATIELASTKVDNGRIQEGMGFIYDGTQVNPVSSLISQIGEGMIEDPVDNSSKAEASPRFSQPITIHGESVGKLIVISDETRQDVDLEIPEIIAAITEQLSARIVNLRLTEQTQSALGETEEQARRLAQLNQMSASLNQAETLTNVYETAVIETPKVLPVDRVGLSLLNDAGDAFKVVAFYGEEPDMPLGTQLSAEGSPMMMAIQENRIVEGTTKDSIMLALFAPLFVGGRAIGTLNLGRKQTDAFDLRDENLLRQIASLVGSSIENMRLLANEQNRARREQLMREIAEKVRGSADMETIMRTAVTEVGRALGRRTYIYLDDQHLTQTDNVE